MSQLYIKTLWCATFSLPLRLPVILLHAIVLVASGQATLCHIYLHLFSEQYIGVAKSAHIHLSMSTNRFNKSFKWNCMLYNKRKNPVQKREDPPRYNDIRAHMCFTLTILFSKAQEALNDAKKKKSHQTLGTSKCQCKLHVSPILSWLTQDSELHLTPLGGSLQWQTQCCQNMAVWFSQCFTNLLLRLE